MTTFIRTYPNFKLRIEYSYSPEIPAQIFGPPERCHDGAPEELEVERVTLLYKDSELVLREADLTALGFMSELCEDMNEKLEEWCREDWEIKYVDAQEAAAESAWETRRELYER